MKFPRKLKVTVFPKYDLFHLDYSNSDQKLHVTGGFEGNLFKLIAEILNFQAEFILPPNADYGYKQENGSYTGMFGLLQNGEVDIAMGGMFATSERSKIGDMTVPYYFDELHFVTSLPKLASKTKVLIEPFTANVWYFVLVFLMLISSLFILSRKTTHSFQEHFFNMFKILIQQGLELEPTDNAYENILHAFWTIASKILALSYTSVLLAFLMVPKMDEVYDTTAKLTQAVLSGNYKCAVLSQSTHFGIMQKSPIPEFQELGNMIVENNWTCDATRQDIFKKTRDHFAVILAQAHIRLLLDDQFVISKDSFFSGMCVIYTKKGFCCKNKLNSVIQRIVEGGIYNKIFDNFLYTHRLKSSEIKPEDTDKNLRKEEKNKSLVVNDIMDAFVLLGIGLGIATSIFIIECIIGNWINNHFNSSTKKSSF